MTSTLQCKTQKKLSDEDLYLEFKCEQGMKKAGFSTKQYNDRLQMELEIIRNLGFSTYFLVVADFIEWSKSQGIAIGPGRGSVAGSLVACTLGITEGIDPIELNLLFERFLNSDRVDFPDIDVDIQDDRRNEVIEYVKSKYGMDHVAQVGTYGTLKAKGAIKAAAKALGLPYEMSNELAGLVLPDHAGKAATLTDSIKEVPKLAAYSSSNTDHGRIIKVALEIEDYIRLQGVHAGGVIIAPFPITEVAPVYLGKSKDDSTKQVTVEFDKKKAEKVGLIKFDFLGLRTLSIVIN